MLTPLLPPIRSIIGRIKKIIHGDRTRKFLQEQQQQQNTYWSGHFGNKASLPDFTENPPTGGGSSSQSPPSLTSTPDDQQPQWPPWLPWAPKATPPPIMSFPPTQAPAPSPAALVSNPSHSIALPPQPPAVVVPADVGGSSSSSRPVVAGDAAGARPPHSSVSRPVYVIAAAGASLAAAVSVAVFVLCYRSNKVVTVRPWATGLSGQLQKAFVTGVPSLKRSELEIACEDFSNVIGSLSDYMVYKGTLSTGVEIAVVSTTKNSAKEWSKHCESQFRKKVKNTVLNATLRLSIQ